MAEHGTKTKHVQIDPLALDNADARDQKQHAAQIDAR